MLTNFYILWRYLIHPIASIALFKSNFLSQSIKLFQSLALVVNIKLICTFCIETIPNINILHQWLTLTWFNLKSSITYASILHSLIKHSVCSLGVIGASTEQGVH